MIVFIIGISLNVLLVCILAVVLQVRDEQRELRKLIKAIHAYNVAFADNAYNKYEPVAYSRDFIGSKR